MENNKQHVSLKKCINIAASEYVKWICHPKMTLILIMFVFLYDMVIKKMLDAADAINTSLSVWEPFIAICNSSVLLLIMPSVYIALMGDFPKVDGNAMFYIQRVGKQIWILGQLLFSVMSAMTYTLIVFIGTAACNIFGAAYANSWSDVTTRYVKFFPNESQSMLANFITGRLYNNMKPIKAFLISFTLMTLYMVLICVMLMTGFIVEKRSIGIGITAAVVCIGSACAQFNTSFKWVFPTAHVLSWLHYDEIYRFQKFKIQYSYLYLIFGILVLYIVDTIFIQKLDFSKISDMES